jgi:hypothetical protein
MQASSAAHRGAQARISLECLATRGNPHMIVICALSALSVVVVIGLVLMVRSKRPDPKIALLGALLDCAKDRCSDTEGDCEM